MRWRVSITEDVAMTGRREATHETTDLVASLIELGRDREAAELGAAARRQNDRAGDRSPARTRGGTMEVLDQLDQLGPALGTVVGGIKADQLDNPTPCSEFTVQGVLEHMVGGATMFAAAFRGQTPPAVDDAGEVLDRFGPALTDLVAAMHEPGALDRPVEAPFGEVPGSTFARFVVLDGLVHGWDLSIATGQPYDPPDALVADVEAFARDTLGPLRDGEMFTAAVEPPAGSTPIERLVSFTGRQITGATR